MKRQTVEKIYHELTSDRDLAILLRAAKARRTRHRATAVILSLLMVVGLGAVWWQTRSTRQGTVEPQIAEAEFLHLEWISEEELLAAFGDQPVAIIGEGDQKQLVLLARDY